jgi:predicted TIM-barrel fold metal-dependent hydrolase
MRLSVRAITLLTMASLTPAVCAAQEPNPSLMAYINTIRAVDNHAHVVAPDMTHDRNFDALPCDALPADGAPTPGNVRFGPDLQAAWKALYGFVGTSDTPDQLGPWQSRQSGLRTKMGAGYYAWVLDQAGLDTVLANRIVMGPELSAPRFRWVPYDDALLLPLDNSAMKATSPDRKILYEAEERLLAAYMTSRGVASRPATLDDYLALVVAPTLEIQKREGALGIKFEAAYLRSLEFLPADRAVAAKVYAAGASGSVDPVAYRQLQDVLFRYIAAEAGRLGLVVQIHTGSGCGTYFDDRGADPLLLDSVLNDASLRQTRFVLLHGGSPFDRHITSLILKPNAWVDTSVLELLFSPAEVARMMRPWLEVNPEHVLFGSDAGPFGPGLGWEETTWIGARKARRALGIALTQMIADGVVTLGRAKEIASGVLRENAVSLYGLK